MSRPLGEFQPTNEGELRERRYPLRPSVEAIRRGESISASEQLTPEDARKLERNAIAAVLIDRSLMQSLQQRDMRGRYGLLYASRPSDFSIPLFNKDNDSWSLTDYQRALRHELVATIRYDLDALITAAQDAQDPMYLRFVSLLDAEGPRGFIEGGVITAIETIQALYEALPEPLPPEEEATILRNSFPVLARLASEHLDLGLQLINGLTSHREYIAMQQTPGGAMRLHFTPAGERAYQTIKNRELNLGRAKTIATGCPALIRGENGSAIEGLLQWYADSFEKLRKDIAK